MRVLVLALGSITLLLLSALAIDWFVIDTEGLGALGLGKMSIGLRSIHACTADGICQSVPMSMVKTSMYSTFAALTFWASIGLAIVVALQAGSRFVTDQAHPMLNKLGYGLAIGVFGNAFMTAYLFAPDLGGGQEVAVEMFSITFSVSRSWAPVMMLTGAVAALFALYYATLQESLSTSVEPIAKLTPSAPIPVVAAPCRKLRFASLTAEITRGGIDAVREDGKAILVVWRDVVGVVARRLPADYEGGPFVDVVSTAGSTLRVLPSTRLSGDPITGATDSDRMHALVELVIARCPDITLDPATRAFVEKTALPAQLPDVATLAAHDERLA